MAKYRINEGGGVVDTEINATIPEDEKNIDWQDYKQWLRDGNVVDPLPAPLDPTGDELLDESDQTMVRGVDWLISFFIAKGTIKPEDIPTELRDLYEARQSYFTAAGGIYTEESKLKKLWKLLIS